MNPISTSRLQLRELTLEDAPFILELVNTPGWLQFIGNLQVHDLAAAQNYLKTRPIKSYETLGYGLYLAELPGTPPVPVGVCGLIKRAGLPHADIGFAFLPAYTGQGYAYEAAHAALAHARNTLQLHPILAITKPDNHRSIKLLQRLGLLFQKPVRLPNDPATELMLFATGALD